MKNLNLLLVSLISIILPFKAARGDSGCPPCAIKQQCEKHVLFLTKRSKEPIEICLPLKLFVFSSIQEMAQGLCNSRSLEPLASGWLKYQDEIAYDAEQAEEFCVLIYMIYHTLLHEHEKEKSVPWINLVGLYMELSAIPLVKLFDILDDCLKHYEKILQSHGGTLPDYAHFKEWISEYWWLPTIMVTMAGITFVRWLKNRPQKVQVSA